MKPRIAQHSHRKRAGAAGRAAVSGRKTSLKRTQPRAQAPSASQVQVPLLLEHFPGAELERVSFAFYAPAAREVLLAGSFNDWQPSATPLLGHQDGRWTVELELRRGRHEYRFVVDGCWTDDPLATGYVRNPFGTLNCLLLLA